MKFHVCLLLLTGVTVALATAAPAGLDNNRILCPVLAAMVKGGHLHPDSDGAVTFEDIYTGLRDKLMCNDNLAWEQAIGIADYDYDHRINQTTRDRCLPGTKCFFDKKLHGPNRYNERYLNIYKMNGLQTVEHGCSTGVRGGANNVPDFELCNGIFPCEVRFTKFYEACADSRGRLYRDNVLCVVCKAQSFGDRGGEFSYNPLQSARQWQMTAAITGWVQAFGRLDPDTKDWYMTLDDARAMILEGRYPDGWTPRKWGGALDLVKAGDIQLPCADEPWWQGTSCPSATGEKCTPIIGSCSNGATCLKNGHCVCGLGKNNISMCAVNGKCVERKSTCTYFGESCTFIPADNPSAPN
mmetsp:Transcript_46667/g.117569  ORF Transcript_46667/g.117569 Transcript_46667/m.117569 type:complete len:355 (-) Transcript_46667:117-1181(-)